MRHVEIRPVRAMTDFVQIVTVSHGFESLTNSFFAAPVAIARCRVKKSIPHRSASYIPCIVSTSVP